MRITALSLLAAFALTGRLHDAPDTSDIYCMPVAEAIDSDSYAVDAYANFLSSLLIN